MSTPADHGAGHQRHAVLLVHARPAADLRYSGPSGDDPSYSVTYREGYVGPAISLTLPVRAEPYLFFEFPPFFDGLLPEGVQLEGLLFAGKFDEHDYLGQLLAVGKDLVGAVSVESGE